MKKARITLLTAGIAVIGLPLMYSMLSGNYLGPVAAKVALIVSVCCLEAAAVLRIVDDRRSGRSIANGVIFAVAIAVMAISAFMGG